jgi:hypothetical protein
MVCGRDTMASKKELSNEKVDKWEKKMDHYYKQTSKKKLLTDLKNTGFIIKPIK